ARQPENVAGARQVTGRVEAVRTCEVGVAQAEVLRLRVHPPHELRCVAVRSRGGERIGRIVRALDQRALDEIAHTQPLAGAQVEGRLADRRGAAADGDDL